MFLLLIVLADDGFVVVFYGCEQRVGCVFFSGEHAIEAHPFGASQGGCLHVVGAFYDCGADILELGVAASFVWRHEYGVG